MGDAQARLGESKLRVITLLNLHKTLTKRELATQGELGWATVVKAVNQLVDEGIVNTAGTRSRPPESKGKRAYLYALAPDRPLAIGVDVEYRVTRVLLTNLNGDTLAESTHETWLDTNEERARTFLFEVIDGFIAENNLAKSLLAGIGIGVPGVGYLATRHRDNRRGYNVLQGDLGERYGVKVRIETNTKAYAVFEKWRNATFAYSDFVFVSIRTGVGTGILYDGHLFTGSHKLSGEIGHMKVVPDGPPCRCGHSGCLESVVNQNYLAEQYRTHVRENDPESAFPYSGRIEADLADLFSRAKAGETPARRIVDAAALYLGRCLANAMLVLDIPNVIISGHFGGDGDAIVEPVERVIRANILPDSDVRVTYVPFDPTGHTFGAALLVLKDYFVDVPRFQLRGEANPEQESL